MNYAQYFIDTEYALYNDDLSQVRLEKIWERWKSNVEKYRKIAQDPDKDFDRKIQDLTREVNKDYTHFYRRNNTSLLALWLGKGANCQAGTKAPIAALQEAGIEFPANKKLGVQKFSDHVQAVIYDTETKEVWSLVDEKRQEIVVAPIYDPAISVAGTVSGLLNGGLDSKEFLIADMDPEIKELVRKLKAKSDQENRNELILGERSKDGLGVNWGGGKDLLAYRPDGRIPAKAKISIGKDPRRISREESIKNILEAYKDAENSSGRTADSDEGDDDADYDEGEELADFYSRGIKTGGKRKTKRGSWLILSEAEAMSTEEYMAELKKQGTGTGFVITNRFTTVSLQEKNGQKKFAIVFSDPSDLVKYRLASSEDEKQSLLTSMAKEEVAKYLKSPELRKYENTLKDLRNVAQLPFDSFLKDVSAFQRRAWGASFMAHSGVVDLSEDEIGEELNNADDHLAELRASIGEKIYNNPEAFLRLVAMAPSTKQVNYGLLLENLRQNILSDTSYKNNKMAKVAPDLTPRQSPKIDAINAIKDKLLDPAIVSIHHDDGQEAMRKGESASKVPVIGNATAIIGGKNAQKAMPGKDQTAKEAKARIELDGQAFASFFSIIVDEHRQQKNMVYQNSRLQTSKETAGQESKPLPGEEELYRRWNPTVSYHMRKFKNKLMASGIGMMGGYGSKEFAKKILDGELSMVQAIAKWRPKNTWTVMGPDGNLYPPDLLEEVYYQLVFTQMASNDESWFSPTGKAGGMTLTQYLAYLKKQVRLR